MVSLRYPKGVVEMRLRRVKINLPLWGRGTALAVDEVGDCHSLPSRRFATLLPPEKAIQKHGAPFGAPCGQLLLYSLNCDYHSAASTAAMTALLVLRSANASDASYMEIESPNVSLVISV